MGSTNFILYLSKMDWTGLLEVFQEILCSQQPDQPKEGNRIIILTRELLNYLEFNSSFLIYIILLDIVAIVLFGMRGSGYCCQNYPQWTADWKYR